MLKMMQTLLLVTLASCVREAVVVPKVYRAEEGRDLGIWWDYPTGTDLSQASITCLKQSDPPQYLYKMAFGSVSPELAHPHFAGRVKVDEDALQEGKVRLRLLEIVADDGGNYLCHLAVGYDPITGKWSLQAYEYFAIEVMGHGSAPRPTPRAGTPSPAGQSREVVEPPRMSMAVMVLGVTLGAFIMLIGVLLVLHAIVGHWQT